MLLTASIGPAASTSASTNCTPEPASQWAPAGFICPPQYGEGTASTWGGPGAARNDCDYPWDECPPLVVTALSTGRSIVVTPSMWCHCYVNAPGPNGETARLIDLDPTQVAALGLDASRGLFRVSVEPATVALPDTAVSESFARESVHCGRLFLIHSLVHPAYDRASKLGSPTRTARRDLRSPWN